MESLSHNPATHGAPTSPANGGATDGGAVVDGIVHQARGESATPPPVSVGTDVRAPRRPGQANKQGEKGETVGKPAAPIGFDRVCALLAEAVIGLMAQSGCPASAPVFESEGPSCDDLKREVGSVSTCLPGRLDEQIIEDLRDNGSASPAALRARLGLQRTPCTKALNRLLAKGVLMSEGSTRNRVYRLALPHQSAAA
jgi:hypothetical protein